MLRPLVIFEKKLINGISYLKFYSFEIGDFYLTDTNSKKDVAIFFVLTGNLSNTNLHTLNYSTSIGAKVDDKYVAFGLDSIVSVQSNFQYEGKFDFKEIQQYMKNYLNCYYYIDKNGYVTCVSDSKIIKELDSVFNNENDISNNNKTSFENKNIPNIKKYGNILNNEDFKVNPAVSREEEIYELIKKIIFKDTSCILVGKPGVGKTSIVKGLAYKKTFIRFKETIGIV